MSRLTKCGAISQRDIDELLEYSDENQFGRNDAYFKLQRYEDLGFTPEEIAYMAKFYKEQTSVAAITADLKIAGALAELDKYKKAEEQGLLLKLPCADGSTIFHIKNNTDACCGCDYFNCGGYGAEDMCKNTKDFTLYPQYAEKPVCEKHFLEVEELKVNINWIFNNRKSFGKTWFLDKEEAEKALEEMEK